MNKAPQRPERRLRDENRDFWRVMAAERERDRCDGARLRPDTLRSLYIRLLGTVSPFPPLASRCASGACHSPFPSSLGRLFPGGAGREPRGGQAGTGTGHRGRCCVSLPLCVSRVRSRVCPPGKVGSMPGAPHNPLPTLQGVDTVGGDRGRGPWWGARPAPREQKGLCAGRGARARSSLFPGTEGDCPGWILRLLQLRSRELRAAGAGSREPEPGRDPPGQDSQLHQEDDGENEGTEGKQTGWRG